MSSTVSGITFVVTNDNIIFPFSTDFLVQHPISLILHHIVGFTSYNGIKVVKVKLSSIDIQSFTFLITGFTLLSLGPYNPELSVDANNCEIKETTNVSDICFKGDDLDILENDEEFRDFDNFVNEYNKTNNN